MRRNKRRLGASIPPAVASGQRPIEPPALSGSSFEVEKQAPESPRPEIGIGGPPDRSTADRSEPSARFSRELLADSRRVFETKLGRPVTDAEAQVLLSRLSEFVRIMKDWQR